MEKKGSSDHQSKPVMLERCFSMKWESEFRSSNVRYRGEAELSTVFYKEVYAILKAVDALKKRSNSQREAHMF